MYCEVPGNQRPRDLKAFITGTNGANNWNNVDSLEIGAAVVVMEVLPEGMNGPPKWILSSLYLAAEFDYPSHGGLATMAEYALNTKSREKKPQLSVKNFEARENNPESSGMPWPRHGARKKSMFCSDTFHL
jgi:hypothetical protein